MTETTTPDDVRDVVKARCRRLMAERAGLAMTWKTRGDRRELMALIEDGLDEWLSVGSA